MVKESIESFFSRDFCRRAVEPLKDNVEIALYLKNDPPITLTKRNGLPVILYSKPEKPSLSFWIPEKPLLELLDFKSEDIGEFGIEIIKKMIHPDPLHKVTVKVHIGPIDFIRENYLGTLFLGGKTVFKYLQSIGLDGVAKITKVISKFRE